jgi:pyruvate/2-oxoacid:ferredoxin oxidoreductase beta subunit
VATASVAYARDLITKVKEALEHQPSYIHVVTTCQISWGHNPERGVEISKLGVRTGLTPLWSCKDGVFKRTVNIGTRRRPITDWLKLQRRYNDVTPEDIDTLERHIDWKNRVIDGLEGVLSQDTAGPPTQPVIK